MSPEPSEGVGPAERTARALALFDRLASVPPEAMPGRWRGEGWPTGHPLDGVLEAWGWLGKQVDAAGQVHPLLFGHPGRGEVRLRPVAPRVALLLARILPPLKWPAVAGVGRRLLPLLSTRLPQARLVQVDGRGGWTSAIVYDRVPIRDVFRRLGDDSLLGMMEMPGMDRPFFFVLRREVLQGT